MKDEVTIQIQIDTDFVAGRYRVTASALDTAFKLYTKPLVEEVMNRIADKLVDMWLDQHAGELLEELAPGYMKQLVSQAIAKKVIG